MRAPTGTLMAGWIGLLLWPVPGAADDWQRAPAQRIELFVAPHQADRITGMADMERAWPGVRIEVFDLGAPARFEAELSEGLPADAARAQRLLEQRIRAHDLEAEALAAFGGTLRAARLGLDRLPAVVFDDRAIVYGVTDLPSAAAEFQTWTQADGQD
jgi:integrating conjugative element protein (TIGR03757 family)